MRLVLLLSVLAPLVLSAYAPSHSDIQAAPGAQPDSSEWENLQVLPDSLTREELTGIMRGFSGGLGVKCGYCHVREEGEFVFASDDKPQKEVARGMIRMVRQINAEILPATKEVEAIDSASGEIQESVKVTCWTCHRSEAKPASPSPQEEPRR